MRLRNVFIGACLVGSAATASANTATPFPTGSLIIPTGSSFQDDCGAVSAYGLIYDVLRANAWLAANSYHTITIYYAYLDTKASPNRCVPTSLDTAPTGSAMWNDGCDITGVSAKLIANGNHATAPTSIVTFLTTGKTNVNPQYPTRTATGTVSYLGGPFIISAGNSGAGGTDVDVFRELIDGTITAKDSSLNNIDFSPFRTKNATQYGAPGTAAHVNSQCSFGTDHYVNIHITTAAITANVGKAFQTQPPRLALLATDNTDTTPASSTCGVATTSCKTYGSFSTDNANAAGTKEVADGILEGYLEASGLTYNGANGCPTSATMAANATVCPHGAVSGQIYDSFDFKDIVNGHLSDVDASGAPKYLMLWTPHWQTNSTLKANETAAFSNIKTFLNGQTGLAAECAGIGAFEGATYTGGASSGSETADPRGLSLQTCLNTSSPCSSFSTNGEAGNPIAPYGSPGLNSHYLIDNCSNPNLATGTACAYYSYPGDSFSQIGDFRWDAEGGWITGFNTTSKNVKSFVPLISITTLTATNKATLIAVPGAYTASTFTRSATDLAARALTGANAIAADLATRSVKDDTAGEANILYLGGHDQTFSGDGVAGTKMMLETLLQLGISTLPPTTTNTEVSRNSPIVATISGNPAVVQGTYEFVSPVPTAPTYSANGASSTFKFPAIKGHLRARTASTITTGGNTFNATGALFDAATEIPDPVNAGCSTWYTASCRTVFTTLAAGVAPTIHYLTTAEVGTGTVGAALGTNTVGTVDLDTSNQTSLLQRILAGDDSAVTGIFKPALGGVDRSTVAVIGSSTLVNSTRATMAYFGADDGMIHAVCASTGTSGCDVLGRELWAYLPRTELELVRYNQGRIDGSPRVFDAFVNNGTGQRSWRTVLVFQTGTGDTTLQSRIPAVYALDVSDPTAPKVLWEYSLADVTHLGTYELGQGLTVAAGQVATGTLPKYDVYAQTNNAGSLGNGNVVTAINVDTGLKDWQNGYQFTTSLRAGGATLPSATGMPGGAVGVDKTLSGYITDLVYGTLYGDLWLVDPATGLSRYSPGTLPAPGNPLLRFSADKHAIGVSPAIYAVSSGGSQYAAFVTGGYTDSYPNDTSWTTAATTQYAMSVNLGTPAADVTINENKGTTGTLTSDIPIKFPLGAGENGYAEISIIDGQLFVTSDSADVNNSATGGYGLAGATGHVYAAAVGGTGLAQSTVVVQGGATSVVASGTTVYSGASNEQMQLATAATGTGTPVETTAATKMTRRLWLRTQ